MDDDEPKKTLGFNAAELEKLRKKFKLKALEYEPKGDSNVRQIEEMIEMNRAVYESSLLSKEQTFLRGMMSSLISIFAKDDVSRIAKARSLGLLSSWLHSKTIEDKSKTKLNFTGDNVMDAFKKEMEMAGFEIEEIDDADGSDSDDDTNDSNGNDGDHG